MHLFYTPTIQFPIFSLDEQESKHAAKVLRLKTGDQVQLIDGKGGYYLAEIESMQTRECVLRIIRELVKQPKRNYRIHLAVAPTKNMDRFEFFIEKVTEIGIDEITPLLCEHSERKVVKNERLHRVCIAAAKQSIKPFLPQINALTDFKNMLKTEVNGFKFVAHCAEDETKLSLKTAYQQGKDVLILIGPEGDFSETEIKMALSAGFTPIRLGSERLRTETAAMVACHTINFMNE